MTDEKVIAWVVYDPDTLELILLCLTRQAAREYAGGDGKIAKVVSSH